LVAETPWNLVKASRVPHKREGRSLLNDEFGHSPMGTVTLEPSEGVCTFIGRMLALVLGSFY